LWSFTASARDRQLFEINAQRLARFPDFDFRTTPVGPAYRTPVGPGAPFGSGSLNASGQAGVSGVLFILDGSEE
jgi:hypothetical protein